MYKKPLNLTYACLFSVLAAPILTASSPGYGNIVVSWRAVYVAVGFFVSIMRSDGLGSMLKENTTNTSLIFSSLDPGTLYTIKAHAWDASGIPGDDFTYNQRTRKSCISGTVLAIGGNNERGLKVLPLYLVVVIKSCT